MGESHHTKAEPWNYPMKAAASTFQKRPHPPPPLAVKYMEKRKLIEIEVKESNNHRWTNVQCELNIRWS